MVTQLGQYGLLRYDLPDPQHTLPPEKLSWSAVQWIYANAPNRWFIHSPRHPNSFQGDPLGRYELGGYEFVCSSMDVFTESWLRLNGSKTWFWTFDLFSLKRSDMLQRSMSHWWPFLCLCIVTLMNKIIDIMLILFVSIRLFKCFWMCFWFNLKENGSRFLLWPCRCQMNDSLKYEWKWLSFLENRKPMKWHWSSPIAFRECRWRHPKSKGQLCTLIIQV